MPAAAELEFRTAGPDDAQAIAALHTDSYAALDGASVEHVAAGAPGEDTAWPNGRPMCFRIAWRDPARLLSRTRTAGA